MIIYLDSSVLARAYFADESGHQAAAELLNAPDVACITGSWTRVEVTGAIIRAGRAGRVDELTLLNMLAEDLGDGGRVAGVAVDQEDIERRALEVVRAHGLGAMGAWHVAVASIVLPLLLDSGEFGLFATRGQEQAAAAKALGMGVW